MRFKGYPKAYKRNTHTKLLWLYKAGIISFSNYTKAKINLIY